MANSNNHADNRSHGPTLADFEPLLPAEMKILVASRAGEPALISTTRPTDLLENTRVRAHFLQFLVVGSNNNLSVGGRPITIQGAWVKEDLDLGSSRITSPLSLILCQFDREVTVADADIAALTLSGSMVEGIQGDRLRCNGNVQLNKGFYATREVRLVGARIAGDLDCSESEFVGAYEDLSGRAIAADNIEIGGDAILTALKATGEVRFVGARIRGALNCAGGKFQRGDDDSSLSCDQAEIGGHLYLNHGFAANGTVRLGATLVGGNLDCTGGQFEQTTSSAAIIADRAEIAGLVLMRENFYAMGGVHFVAARVRGILDCSGGAFNGGFGGDALSLYRAIIDSSVHLRNGFRANGSTYLYGTNIGGNLDCSGGSFDAGDESKPALICRKTQITDVLMFRNVRSVRGRIDLAGSKVGALVDDLASWQWASGLAIDGFEYDRFGDSAPTDAKSRVLWLDLQDPDHLQLNFRPQPWEQVIKVLRKMGLDFDASTVAIQKQIRLRRAGKIRGVERFLHRAFGFFSAYGYRPFRLVAWLGTVWLISSLIFLVAARQGVMAPVNLRNPDQTKYDPCRPEQLGNWTRCSALPYEYTNFSPFLYSLDLILPAIDLQQKKDWAPMIREPCSEVGFANVCWRSARYARELGQTIPITTPALSAFGILAWGLMLTEILIGWVISLILAGRLTGIIKVD
jgi:hypothetical protein